MIAPRLTTLRYQRYQEHKQWDDDRKGRSRQHTQYLVVGLHSANAPDKPAKDSNRPAIGVINSDGIALNARSFRLYLSDSQSRDAYQMRKQSSPRARCTMAGPAL